MDVVLVSMPMAEVQRPSIALGLLQGAVAGTGIRSEVLYANLRFAETIGLVTYQALLSAPTDHLLGEWCFSKGLFPDFRPDDEAYLDLVLEVRSQGFPPTLQQRKETMVWVRSKTVGYLERLAQAILEKRPRIVGCSSVFQQHCASLALLKRIRELSPDTVTLMGGANCEGEMGVETLRVFPWVDCVVSGEADLLFPELCRLLLERGREVDPSILPHGAMTKGLLDQEPLQRERHGTWPPRGIVRDLDRLPLPDYSSYFESLHASTLSNLIDPGIPAESSRGCWWGEKSHCTFCGLNGFGMRYRSKSPERVISELDELSAQYGLRQIQFVDNILDMTHVKTLLPGLAAAKKKYSLFYETKSNLKREQVQLLAEAGVGWIQPGLESLDDRALKLIGKGNSALMNLQLLKWTAEFGIHASWNMLCGLPGECDEWYEEMAEWLPLVHHLQPPSGVIRVRFDRFSPYHMRPQEYGLALRPSRAYSHVYPLSEESLMRLAYSFEDANRPGHVHRGVPDLPGQRALEAAVRQWRSAWERERPTLRVRSSGGRLHVTDTRPCSSVASWTMEGLPADVYDLCLQAQTSANLTRRLNARGKIERSLGDVEEATNALINAKLMLRLNDRFLSLGIDPPQGDTVAVHSRELFQDYRGSGAAPR